MELLPVDVVKIIFYKLGFYEQLAFKSTCKKYYALQIKLIPTKLHAKLTDDILSRFPALEKLILWNNNNITDIGLRCVPNLKVLMMYKNTKITDDGIKCCKKLQHFQTLTNNISDISHLTELTELNIQNNVKIRNAVILQNAKNLRLLKIVNSNIILADSVIENLENLEYLYSRRIDTHFSDVGLQNLKKLKMLLTDNSRITNSGLLHMKNLRFLCLPNHIPITQVPENCIVMQRPYDDDTLAELHTQIFNTCNFSYKYK